MILFAGNIEGKKAYLWPEEILHCTKVLRKKVGDSLFVTNGKGESIEGEIVYIGKNEVEIKVHKAIVLPSQTTGLHIAMALTKNMDRFEFFVEKATELGVSEITPLVSFHSERKKVRLDKLEKKALAADKQSLRSNFIQIHPLISFSDFLATHTQEDMYMAHCNENFPRTPIQEFPNNTPSIVLIGPEGDFAEQEIEQFMQSEKHQSVHLGPNRLRTETAGIWAASYFYNSLIL